MAERRFFRRSPSTTCLGYVPPSPFSPLSEALPLAERPHLLEAVQVGARDNCKAALFGFQHATRLECWPRCPLDDPPILNLISTKDNTTKLQSGKKQSGRSLLAQLVMLHYMVALLKPTIDHVEECSWSHKITLLLYYITPPIVTKPKTYWMPMTLRIRNCRLKLFDGMLPIQRLASLLSLSEGGCRSLFHPPVVLASVPTVAQQLPN